MPKKMKLDLEELNIQSFVTSLDDQEKHRLRGGDPHILNKATAATCDGDGPCFTISCTDPDIECSAAGC